MLRSLFRVLLLLVLGVALMRSGQAQPVVLGNVLSPGAPCGFIAPCTRIGEIGLHVAALASVRSDKDRSFVDAQGQARISVTFLDLVEVGGVFAGHIGRDRSGAFFAVSSPATVYARLRLLPLPFFRPLADSHFRLALHAQHDFVNDKFGAQEAPGVERTSLLAVGGKSYGPIDVDGSVGFVVSPDGKRRPQQAAFQLGLAASYWLARPDTERPRDQLRLQLEVLYQFAQDRRFSNQGTLLAGLWGMSRNGIGGSLAVGPEFSGGSMPLHPRGGEPRSALPSEGDLERSPLNAHYVGVRIIGGVQFLWGPHVRNPWAEKKAAEPKTTPAWIWELLGAIDPILGADGCVWSDPTPQRPSYQMFCIGKPDPQNAGMILLDNGMRLAVGTHLWEHGASLRINDGTEVARIPLSSRFRSAVLDYVDGLRRAASHAAEPDPAICEGRIDPVPRGIDPGLAAVVANDDFGGAAAALGMQLYREITCNPEAQTAASLGSLASLVGKLPGRGPLRAKPNLADHIDPPTNKPRSGGGGDSSVATHTNSADAARLINPSKASSPVWREARPYKGELRRNGDEIWAWDKLHNDIEVYDKRGRHLGSRNPITGELYKPPVPGRWIDL